MKIKQLHNWNVTIDEARRIQLELQEKIKLEPLTTPVDFVAGADVSYSKKTRYCYAAVTIFKFPEMEPVERTEAIGSAAFPYVPGYLTFREAPILLEAFAKTKIIPDLVLFDGQGIAHPRRMGLATHLGVILDLPSIGCAKSRLVGEYQDPPAPKGSRADLIFKGELIGSVVRTREKVKPLFVSPGFKISIEQAAEWVLTTCTNYRLPEPTRQSHLSVNQLRIKFENKN